MHEAHVVHGRLDADHVVLTDDGPTFVGFGGATNSSGSLPGAAADVAELLVTTAVVAGDEPAVVAAALAAVPRSRFEASLAFLQPAALTPTDAPARGAGPAGAPGPARPAPRSRRRQPSGTTPPELTQLRRIAPASLGLAIGTLVAAGVLLGEIGDPTEVWDAFQHTRNGLDRRRARPVVRVEHRLRHRAPGHGARPAAVVADDRAAGRDVVHEPGAARVSVGSRCRCATCSVKASISAPPWPPAGCSAPSATSSSRSGCSCCPSPSRPHTSTSGCCRRAGSRSC